MNTANLTRRQAVAAGGTGLLGLTLNCPLWGKEREIPSFSFIVVSDTHLGRNESESPARQWAKLAKQVDATPGDLVLHLGDIVDGGRESQYPVYKEIRKSINKPVYEIPGNHDPQEAFEKHLRKPVELAVDHKGVRFLLLNNSKPTSHDGFLTAGQLDWLGKQCDDAARKDRFLILCMHVPAHANKHPDRGWYVKPKDGQAELYALLTRHKDRVLALLHGHFHNGVRGWDDHAPLHEIALPSALYNQDRRLAEQKAPGYYLAELRPGFVQITLESAGMKLAYHVLDGKESASKECPLPQLNE